MASPVRLKGTAADDNTTPVSNRPVLHPTPIPKVARLTVYVRNTPWDRSFDTDSDAGRTVRIIISIATIVIVFFTVLFLFLDVNTSIPFMSRRNPAHSLFYGSYNAV